MKDFYMCTNINHDEILYIFWKIHNEWEGWTPIPIFPIESILLTLLSLQFLQSYTTNFQQTLLFCFLFSESYT